MKITRGVGLRVDATWLEGTGSLALRGRVLCKDGTVSVVAALVRVTPSNTLVSELRPLPEGELVALSVEPVATAFRRGAVTALVRLWYGELTGGACVGEVCSGFPSLDGGCRYLEGDATRLDGREALPYALAVASPAAGAEWTLSLGLRRCADLLAAKWRLTTSAVAATRYPGLLVTLEGGDFLRYVTASGLAASSAYTFEYAVTGAATIATGLWQMCPMGPVSLTAGMSIGSVTTNMDAGDQIADVFLYGRWYPALWPDM
jgi:hypothetical protein